MADTQFVDTLDSSQPLSELEQARPVAGGLNYRAPGFIGNFDRTFLASPAPPPALQQTQQPNQQPTALAQIGLAEPGQLGDASGSGKAAGGATQGPVGTPISASDLGLNSIGVNDVANLGIAALTAANPLVGLIAKGIQTGVNALSGPAPGTSGGAPVSAGHESIGAQAAGALASAPESSSQGVSISRGGSDTGSAGSGTSAGGEDSAASGDTSDPAAGGSDAGNAGGDGGGDAGSGGAGGGGAGADGSSGGGSAGADGPGSAFAMGGYVRRGRPMAMGGRVPGRAAPRDMAAGGPISGAGDGNDDDVPISAPSGSFIMPESATRFYGTGFLEGLIEQFEHRTGREVGSTGGGVSINASDGEFALPPEVAAFYGAPFLNSLVDAATKATGVKRGTDEAGNPPSPAAQAAFRQGQRGAPPASAGPGAQGAPALRRAAPPQPSARVSVGGSTAEPEASNPPAPKQGQPLAVSGPTMPANMAMGGRVVVPPVRVPQGQAQPQRGNPFAGMPDGALQSHARALRMKGDLAGHRAALAEIGRRVRVGGAA